MQVFTGYFAKHRHVPGAVSIARWEPPGARGLIRIIELAPSLDLLKGFKAAEVSEKQYTLEYLKGLGRLGIEAVDARLREGMTLLCWEGPGKFCHRHLLANWLRKHGYTVEERA